MILFDVNILLYAMREDRPEFSVANQLLRSSLTGEIAVAWHPLLASTVLRIATNPNLPGNPSTADECIAFLDDIRAAPATVEVREGSGFWQHFTGLTRRYGLTGNQIPDAYLAALAIENGATFVTSDRGFSRFKELSCRLVQFE